MYGFFYCLSERIPLPVDTKAARVEPLTIGKWAGILQPPAKLVE
jgi:hypothetical protein